MDRLVLRILCDWSWCYCIMTLEQRKTTESKNVRSFWMPWDLNLSHWLPMSMVFSPYDGRHPQVPRLSGQQLGCCFTSEASDPYLWSCCFSLIFWITVLLLWHGHSRAAVFSFPSYAQTVSGVKTDITPTSPMWYMHDVPKSSSANAWMKSITCCLYFHELFQCLSIL